MTSLDILNLLDKFFYESSLEQKKNILEKLSEYEANEGVKSKTFTDSVRKALEFIENLKEDEDA